MTGPPDFRLIEHTADIGLEANAPTLAGLFVAAARGLRALSFGNSPATSSVRVAVHLEGGDCGELLVAWLNEILYLMEAKRLVPACYEIVTLGEHELEAVVSAETFRTDRHVVERTAKAVTYHRLVVEERVEGWHARVYIDL